jgi:Na+-transporting methylmalonyl-CoA/oxaloacetate decarboxylase gamma subunit
MSIEALVSFIVFLVLSLLVLAMRWLNEKLRGEISLRDLFPSEAPPKQRDREAPDTGKPAGIKRKQLIRATSPATAPQHRALKRLRLDNKAHLRQAIVTMTVLGPCRALETPHENHSSSTR